MKLPIDPVLHLLHRAPAATLATHSAQLPGYPYATVVPNVVDAQHCPVLLISALAEHTKNLLADPRVSLSVVDPAADDVASATRLTLVGNAEALKPDAALQARYLRYQPNAAQYLQLDFLFFRIVPQRVRFIAGVGQMGWFDRTEWTPLPTLPEPAEAALLAALEPACAPTVELLGIDPFGLDYRQNGLRQRGSFTPAGITNATPEAIAAQARTLLASLR